MPEQRGTLPALRTLAEIDGFHASLTLTDSTQALPSNLLSQSEWSTVQEIRKGLEDYLRKFTEVSQALNPPTLIGSFPDGRHLYEAGIFAFRSTLTGPTPHTLARVFALCSLSYVVSCILQKIGKLDSHQILAGVAAWRDELYEEDRQAFERLAEALWPKARHHFPATSSSLADVPGALAANLEAPHQEFNFADFDYGWTDPRLPAFLTPTAQFATTDEARVSSPQLATAANIADADVLQNTGVFSNLVLFFQECGDLMYNLSGRGETAKSLQQCLTFLQEGQEAKKRIQGLLLMPLRCEIRVCNDSAHAVLSTAERFVELGYLQTVPEVQYYLTTVGKEILGGGEVYTKFRESVYAAPTSAVNAQSSRPLPIRPARERARTRRNNFRCATCGREFNRRYNLKRHEDNKQHGLSSPRGNLVSVNATA